ncbi:MAG: type II/IV secretion system ATPase subunit [Candidatus Aenigmatarchaeota archaeon]|nr:MAG: type II/IV secretion system ATPase subunit [Candidatus Aenigmarchaeota archaeon]
MKVKRVRTKKPAVKEKPSPQARKIITSLKKGVLAKKDLYRKKGLPPSKEVFVFPGTGKAKIPQPPAAPALEAEKVVSKEVEGIEMEIPKTPAPLTVPLSSEEKEMLKNINITYPLIPERPKKSERVYAYSRIRWDARRNELVYSLVEPHITDKDSKIIEDVKRELEERLDIDFMKIGQIRAKELLMEEIKNIISKMKGVDKGKIDIITYYIYRDIVGLGKIEPLMRDKDIEDISCDGEKIPLYVYHRNPLFGSMITNVMFKDEDELDTFVMKLSQKCGKSISVAEPLVEGSLTDGSRVHATLGTDIARRGSNFTIRKFTKAPLTPIHMLRYGTLDSTQFAYLWLAIENRKSILVSGGTATGKTSLLNALSLFIRPGMKIVSIEDTPELRLPHPHWIPEVARTPISEKKKASEVSLFDLLKTSLRQRPDYIIVGEVRGAEAFVLFQQIATGHAGLATIHAASLPQLVDRLTTPPINLPPNLIQNLDVIIFLLQVKSRDRYVRRANQILEVTGLKGDRPVTTEIFSWKPVEDRFETKEKSHVLEHIAKSLGLTEASLREELRVRKSILEWMLEKQMFDYREIAKIIKTYYSDPEKIITLVEET